MEKVNVNFKSWANVSSDLVETRRRCDCADETDVKESAFVPHSHYPLLLVSRPGIISQSRACMLARRSLKTEHIHFPNWQENSIECG